MEDMQHCNIVATCPFYLGKGQTYIVCEGIISKKDRHLFNTYAEGMKWFNSHCVDFKNNACPYSKILYSVKYPD